MIKDFYGFVMFSLSLSNSVQNIKNDKHLKPISNGNIANTSMIALLEEPLPCRKT